MAGPNGTVVRGLVALVLSLAVDISLFYASGCFDTLGASGRLARLWLFAVLRCVVPCLVTLLCLGRLEPSLLRFTVTHGLLPAVFESGSRALHHEETPCALAADAHCWLMCAGASLAAALFWEITVPDKDGEATDKDTRQRSRQLFVRVLLLYKPYYHLLLGGLLFLSLAVICESLH